MITKISIILFLLLLFLLSILMLTYHFSRVFSKTGFENGSFIFLSSFYSISGLSIISIGIFVFIIDKYSEFHFLMAIPLHLFSFELIYMLTLSFLKLIQALKKHIKIIPNEYLFYDIPLHKNNSVLKLAFLISYFLSTLVFIFIIQNYFLSSLGKTGLDTTLLQLNFKHYSDIFVLSFVPILYSYLKNK